jgi:putative Ca2+/H+ antiporter (TMEM165/GDT1 family)
VFSKKLHHAPFKGDGFSLIEGVMSLIFGIMVEKNASSKDKKAKKKNIGEPSNSGLQIVVTTIIMFSLILVNVDNQKYHK